MTSSNLFNPIVRDYDPPDPAHQEYTPEPDRALFADPEKKALFGAATRVEDLTESIGTYLEGIQLHELNDAQKDELALLVAERGVVFFRDQNITTDQQTELFSHYGKLDTHPAQQGSKVVNIGAATFKHREMLNWTPWPQADFHADTSFELNPPSYSMLRMVDAPPVGGDTVWVSMYGAYDELSDAFKKIVSDLHANHTSSLQFETLLQLWGTGPRRKPIDTHHPLVRSHPVTKLQALNYNPGFCVGIPELNKEESNKIAEFLVNHLNAAADHQVRWKWTRGSVAMWDNRCSCHRVIPGKYKEERNGIRTTVFGERPFYDPTFEGREERETRLSGQRMQRTRNLDVKAQQAKSKAAKDGVIAA